MPPYVVTCQDSEHTALRRKNHARNSRNVETFYIDDLADMLRDNRITLIQAGIIKAVIYIFLPPFSGHGRRDNLLDYVPGYTHAAPHNLQDC